MSNKAQGSQVGSTRHHNRNHCIKGGNSVAFPKQARYTLCAGREGWVYKEERKAYLGMDSSYLGEVRTAQNLALIFVNSHTLSAPADEMQGRWSLLAKHTRGCWRTVKQVGCIYEPAYHLGKQAETEQVTWSQSKEKSTAEFLWTSFSIRIYQAGQNHTVDNSGHTSVKKTQSRCASVTLPFLTAASFWLEHSFCRCDGPFLTNLARLRDHYVPDSCSHLLLMTTYWLHSLSFRKQPYF